MWVWTFECINDAAICLKLKFLLNKKKKEFHCTIQWLQQFQRALTSDVTKHDDRLIDVRKEEKIRNERQNSMFSFRCQGLRLWTAQLKLILDVREISGTIPIFWCIRLDVTETHPATFSQILFGENESVQNLMTKLKIKWIVVNFRWWNEIGSKLITAKEFLVQWCTIILFDNSDERFRFKFSRLRT